MIEGGAGAAAALERFGELLESFGRVTDLLGGGVTSVTVEEMVQEALAALPVLPLRGALVDVGSGNGLPVIPILVVRPELVGTLLEPRERRWAFLREVVRDLGLQADVLRERVAEHRGGPYDVMTVRGLAAGVWAGEAGRLLRPGGIVAWWTSGTAADAAVSLEPVITSPLPGRGHGTLAVWRRCFT